MVKPARRSGRQEISTARMWGCVRLACLVQVWRAGAGLQGSSPVPAQHFAAHDGAVTELAYHSSGRYWHCWQLLNVTWQLLYGASGQCSRVVSNSIVLLISATSSDLAGLMGDAACRWLLSCALDATLRLWDLSQGSLHYTLHAHEGAVLACAFSPSGRPANVPILAGGSRALLQHPGCLERRKHQQVV